MKKGKWKKLVLAAVCFFLLWMSAGQDVKTSSTPIKTAVIKWMAQRLEAVLYGQFLVCAASPRAETGVGLLAQKQMESILPLYAMARRESTRRAETGDYFPEDTEDERHSILLEYEDIAGALPVEEHESDTRQEDLQELLRQENEASAMADFVPHERKMQVDLEELKNYETLVRTFYTIDTNTMAGSDQLNAEELLARDLRVDKSGGGPKILIYHTHSQEGFADSVPGDETTTIVGVGERLAKILRERYGYQVLHHTGRYDVESRDNAYGNALPDLEELLAANPSIKVVIDLHRDQMTEENKLVLNLDGRPTARFMFFNGLSRTKKTGDISYLENPNIADNLAFSFQLQLKAAEYYPGLTRKIYLKGYRYNMHLCPRSLLVELGAQNNTVEEAMNACDPLAHLLDLVLSGE